MTTRPFPSGSKTLGTRLASAFPVLASAFIATALAIPLVVAFPLMAQESSKPAPYAGVYTDPRIRLELQSTDGTTYIGKIVAGELRMPVSARATGSDLTGTFENAGSRFQFRAVPTANGLTFDTDGTRYELKKEVPATPVNPLANPGPPNPLGAPLPATGAAAAAAVPPVIPPPLNAAAAAVPPPLKSAGSPEKDPLAYRILDLQGGSIAKFDNWVYSPVMHSGGIAYCDSYPQGRQGDFVMRAAVATPNSQDLANLFTMGPQLVQQVLMQFFGPVFRPSGDARKTLCGGDEAMVESYDGTVNGQKGTCRAMYVKRKDIAIAIMAIGTEHGFKQYGRSIEIVAQSIHFKESALEAGLLGTWVAENFSSAGGGGAGAKVNVSQARSIAFYPNGTFSDTARSGFSGPDVTGLVDGGSRGTVVKRGNLLTFHYDNNNTWTAPYELFSNGLKLDGQIYLKQ